MCIGGDKALIGLSLNRKSADSGFALRRFKDNRAEAVCAEDDRLETRFENYFESCWQLERIN